MTRTEHGAEDDPVDGGGHEHGSGPDADRRYLITALALLVAFMITEVVAAFASGSLALLSDAGHLLSDVGAIGASLWEPEGPAASRLSAHVWARFPRSPLGRLLGWTFEHVLDGIAKDRRHARTELEYLKNTMERVNE